MLSRVLPQTQRVSWMASRCAVRYASTAPLPQTLIKTVSAPSWDALPFAQKQEVAAQVKERMLAPWNELTPQEIKTAYYISYGQWGPRTPLLKKGEGVWVFKAVVAGIAIGVALFLAMRLLMKGNPVSMNREWQLESDKYLKEHNSNPWGGYSQVQSRK